MSSGLVYGCGVLGLFAGRLAGRSGISPRPERSAARRVDRPRRCDPFPPLRAGRAAGRACGFASRVCCPAACSSTPTTAPSTPRSRTSSSRRCAAWRWRSTSLRCTCSAACSARWRLVGSATTSPTRRGSRGDGNTQRRAQGARLAPGDVPHPHPDDTVWFWCSSRHRER